MIQANELRIGNYFKDSIVRIFIVEGIKLEYVYFLLSNGTKMKYKKNTLQPIQLTEEIKEKMNEDELILVDKLGFVIFKNSYAYQFVFEDYPYLHQLQNLYFALTGKELTI
jgi:hypothetical protein